MAAGQSRVLSLHPTFPTSSAHLLPHAQGNGEETGIASNPSKVTVSW